MALTITTSVIGLALITGGLLSGKDELKRINFNDFHSKLMGYQYWRYDDGYCITNCIYCKHHLDKD